MLNLITAGASLIFPSARIFKLLKTGIEVTNSTNPMVVAKNITLVVFQCCTPPPLRLVGHCIGASFVIGASITCPNPITVGSAIHLLSEIYENC